MLLGVTGSGKTFTMAKVIQQVQRPALILAPNKTLAAQLYSEMKNFFPENAVEYFVSYYDYYQPEAYIPRTDTYIEKDSSVNEQIDRMRHSATRAILERDDVIIVASVSCIYGIGAVETYSGMAFGLDTRPAQFRARSCSRDWSRCNFAATTRRSRAAVSASAATRSTSSPRTTRTAPGAITLFGDEVDSIFEFDPLTGRNAAELETVKIYANSHYVTPRPTLAQAVKGMREELRLAAGMVPPRRQAARGPAHRAAHAVRSRDDRGHGLVRGHRELFALAHGAPPRRAAADPVRISAGRSGGVRR